MWPNLMSADWNNITKWGSKYFKPFRNSLNHLSTKFFFLYLKSLFISSFFSKQILSQSKEIQKMMLSDAVWLSLFKIPLRGCHGAYSYWTISCYVFHSIYLRWLVFIYAILSFQCCNQLSKNKAKNIQIDLL